MPITNGYATVEEARDWIGLSDSIDDLLIADIVTAVSRWIDGYCNRQFWQTAAGTARVFDSIDGYCIDFGNFDLTTATAVKTDENDDGVYEITWAASDYQLLPRNITSPEPSPYREIRAINRWFPTGWWYPIRVGLVEITGTWGWPSVPQAVNQACRMQVSRVLQRRKSPEGVAGWGEFGPMRVSSRLDPDVQTLLNSYRLPVAA